ncbi:MAG: prepilin-type N-terminal cleavage/methylation domain-containing protein [Rubrivivax sp.]|nr:prepilin-type N-terminal cleavage/methylation domain-containing protein [Rubrivivax sp.]
MNPAALPRRRGFTLVDLLVVITVTGIIAGTLTGLFSNLAARSAEVLRQREALTLAQALLAEVRSMPFTYCDPQDARATLATGAFLGGTGCATRVDAFGPEPGESRYNPATRFDGVSDYAGFTMPGPGCASFCDRNGAPLGGAARLAGCQLRVNTVAQALPGLPAFDANGRPQALRIIVTLACPGRADVVAEGVRVRHAPNSF